MTIRFVYFDLGNILFSFERQLASSNLATLLDVSVGDADRVLHQEGLQEDLEHGRLSDSQYASEVCRRLGRENRIQPSPSGPDVTVQEILDAISDMFTPIDCMAAVMSRTRATVGRIGILSNTCDAHWSWIQRMKSPILQQTVDETVLSCRVGCMKPDAKIYEHAESAAGCRGDEILFLDDRPENIAAAKSRKWHAEHCLGGPTAIQALQRYNILPAGSPDSLVTDVPSLDQPSG